MNLRWMIGWMAVVVTAGALRAAMTAGAAERLAARMIEQEPALKMAFGGHKVAEAEAAQFTLNARGAINARATTQAGAVEVTDATGQTEGRSAAAGQRYFRLPLTETGTSGFFSVSVFSEEVSE